MTATLIRKDIYRATIKGEVFEGTADELAKIARVSGTALIIDGYYNSSKGLIKLTDMHRNHLFNAFLKNFRSQLDAIGSDVAELDEKEFINRVIGLTASPEVETLFLEISRRAKA